MISALGSKLIYLSVAIVLLVVDSAVVCAERPTRQQVQTYAVACANNKQKANFISKFGTDFSGLDLSGINFRGPHAVNLETNLRGADFSGANLANAMFGAAELQGVNFSGADLTNATFTTASLVDANLTGVVLTGSRFYQSDLNGIAAPGLDWSSSDITGSSLSNAELDDCKFSGVKSEYWGNNFSGSTLSNADFTYLDMKHADFTNADLSGVNFTGAILEEANFRGANLKGAVFDQANLRAAIFTNAKGIEDKQRNELLGKAKRWHFDATNNVQWFFDSPVFPVFLFVAIPLFILAYRAMTFRSTNTAERDVEEGGLVEEGMEEEDMEEQLSDGQFKLSTLLWIVFGVGLYFGVGVWSLYGLYSLTMMLAFFVLVERVLFHPSSRRLAGGILAFATVYAGLNLACFVLAINTDPFLIINLGFMAFATLLGPMMSVIFATVICYRLSTISGAFAWREVTAFAVLMCGIGWANFWVFLQAIASV